MLLGLITEIEIGSGISRWRCHWGVGLLRSVAGRVLGRRALRVMLHGLALLAGRLVLRWQSLLWVGSLDWSLLLCLVLMLRLLLVIRSFRRCSVRRRSLIV